MNQVNLSRKHYLAPQIVFVDGLSGSGKTALSFILSCLERVEVHKIDPLYEQLCVLRSLDKISPEATIALIKLHTDISCHDGLIARGANFRPKDASSVLLKKELYEQRLLLDDGETVLTRIKNEKPILHLMTHQNIQHSQPLFDALEDRCTIFEMVRNPLFLITAWYAYMDRYGTDPLEFDLCFDYDGEILPWFAKGWENKFCRSSKMDKIIYSLEHIIHQKNIFLSKLPQNILDRILIIPFKKLVTNPWPFIEKMEAMLKTRRLPLLDQVLKDQNIPRKFINEVPDNEAFKKYGWNTGTHNNSEEIEMQKQWDFVRSEASPEAINVLEKISREYESTYLQ